MCWRWQRLRPAFDRVVVPAARKYLKDRSNHFEVHLELTAKDTLQDFVSTIRALGIRIDDH